LIRGQSAESDRLKLIRGQSADSDRLELITGQSADLERDAAVTKKEQEWFLQLIIIKAFKFLFFQNKLNNYRRYILCSLATILL
jgi:hypothetical protein